MLQNKYCSNILLNYHGNFYNIEFTKNDSKLLCYDSKLLQYFNPTKSGIKITPVIYPDIFLTLAPLGSILTMVIIALG